MLPDHDRLPPAPTGMAAAVSSSQGAAPSGYDACRVNKRASEIKKRLVQIMALCIPSCTLRKRFRYFLLNIRARDFVTACQFKRAQVAPKSVLIIEYNSCHGETLPGYVHYFLQLGYGVDVLAHHRVVDEHPFVRMEEGSCRVFASGSAGFPLFLSASALDRYECVFVATSRGYDLPLHMPAVSDRFPQLQRHRNLLCVVHDLADVADRREQSMLLAERMVTLGRFPVGTMVAPHAFGRVMTAAGAAPKRFLVVGAHVREGEARELFDALTEVLKIAPTMELVLVGWGPIDIPEALRPHLVNRGRLSFEQMFAEVERASFILALLNPGNPLHERYMTTSISGSLLLSYGFRKPLVIHSAFVRHCGLSSSTAVIYEQKLADGMLTAVGMQPPDYQAMQRDLGQLSDAIYDESLNHLQRLLEGKAPKTSAA